MPIYEYFCPDCQNKFELLRSVSQADNEAKCPTCKATGLRTMSKVLSRTRDGSGAVGSGGGSCGSCSSSGCGSCH